MIRTRTSLGVDYLSILYGLIVYYFQVSSFCSVKYTPIIHAAYNVFISQKIFEPFSFVFFFRNVVCFEQISLLELEDGCSIFTLLA